MQFYDALIEAAYIPYETDPNKVGIKHSATLGGSRTLRFAFTAAMNGCSLAMKKTAGEELTVWHYPSPDSNPEEWKEFKRRNSIAAIFDWADYNSLKPEEISKLFKNHVTTTIMFRDMEGWKIKSQQNVGPQGGDQRRIVHCGNVVAPRLAVGQDLKLDVEGGSAKEK